MPIRSLSLLLEDFGYDVQCFLARRRFILLALLSLVVAMATLPAAIANSGLAEVHDIRFGVNGQGVTRIVIDLSENASYRVVTDLRDGQAYLDVDVAARAVTIPTAMVVGVETIGTGTGVGAADTYSYRLLGGEDPRLQIRQALSNYAIPSAVFVLKPKGAVLHYRLVIDLKPASKAQFMDSRGHSLGALALLQSTRPTLQASSQATEPEIADGREAPFGAVTAEQTRTAALQQPAASIIPVVANVPTPRIKPKNRTGDGRLTIAIDPGHGGRDPGAVGPTGALEKSVTLTAAKELRKKLLARGYNVILTRDSDKHLDRDKAKDLEMRIDLARETRADMFISIHADAHDDGAVRGASVYTLSHQGSKRLLKRVNASGNFVLAGEDMSAFGTDVAQMLVDIAENGTRRESHNLANHLVAAMEGRVKMVNNNHRQASYAVLLSPDVPAVLLEMGFISNESDEKNLQSKRWRSQTLSAVVQGIDDYFEAAQATQAASMAGGTP